MVSLILMNRRFFFFTVLVFVGSEARTQPKAPPWETVSAAELALQRGDLLAAEKLLGPIVARPRLAVLPPRDRVRILELWGDVLVAREDPERALAAFDEARSIASGEAKTELTLRQADCFLALSDLASASKLLETLNESDRARPRARFLSAVVIYAADDHEQAQQRFEALFAREPTAETAHYLGVIAYEQGALEEALKKFSAAIEMDPGDYYSRVYRSRCLLDLHQVAEAERELREVKAHRPTPEVLCLFGRALMRQRREREALAAFRAAMRDHPSYSEAMFGEATVLRRLGDVKKAREAAERFRRIHLRQDQERRRLDALHQKILRSPSRWQLRMEIARLSRVSGDLEAAERHAWRAVRLAPEEVRCRLLLARILVDQGRYQAAAVQYQRILRRHPDHDEARGELERMVSQHARRAR